MIRKELLDQRSKLSWGLAICLVVLVGGVLLTQNPASLSDPGLKASVAEARPGSPAYFWGLLFDPLNSLGLVVLILSAAVGTSLIAGEVAQRTIFVLLSRPLSRDRILLTKYGVGAAGLLAIILIAGLALLILAAVAGHPQPLGGALISALLLWLGCLFVLGVATLFSVLFSDVLRPLALTLGVVALLALLPAALGLSAGWSLPSYWSSFPAFLGQSAPLREVLVSAVAAALPISLALILFRRRQY